MKSKDKIAILGLGPRMNTATFGLYHRTKMAFLGKIPDFWAKHGPWSLAFLDLDLYMYFPGCCVFSHVHLLPEMLSCAATCQKALGSQGLRMHGFVWHFQCVQGSDSSSQTCLPAWQQFLQCLNWVQTSGPFMLLSVADMVGLASQPLIGSFDTSRS